MIKRLGCIILCISFIAMLGGCNKPIGGTPYESVDNVPVLTPGADNSDDGTIDLGDLLGPGAENDGTTTTGRTTSNSL